MTQLLNVQFVFIATFISTKHQTLIQYIEMCWLNQFSLYAPRFAAFFKISFYKTFSFNILISIYRVLLFAALVSTGNQQNQFEADFLCYDEILQMSKCVYETSAGTFRDVLQNDFLFPSFGNTVEILDDFQQTIPIAKKVGNSVILNIFDSVFIRVATLQPTVNI